MIVPVKEICNAVTAYCFKSRIAGSLSLKAAISSFSLFPIVPLSELFHLNKFCAVYKVRDNGYDRYNGKYPNGDLNGQK